MGPLSRRPADPARMSNGAADRLILRLGGIAFDFLGVAEIAGANADQPDALLGLDPAGQNHSPDDRHQEQHSYDLYREKIFGMHRVPDAQCFASGLASVDRYL